MPIVSQSHTETPQSDGRSAVREIYVDDAGETYAYDWLGDAALVADVMAWRVAMLNDQIAARQAAQAVVDGTLIPLTKLQFRELFTAGERQGIDALNEAYATNPALSAGQKAAIRTGLEDFRAAQNIRRPFDSRVGAMLDLYVAFGLLTPQRRGEIMAAGNGNG